MPLRVRVMPSLLLRGSGFVKTVKFKNSTYLGDPINIVRIFNEKEVDELVVLDIEATSKGALINYEILESIASEAFMPMCYGGGVRSLEEIQRILNLGYEKVILSSAALENPELVGQAARHFGSQSIVVCIDFKKKIIGGYSVYTHNGKRNAKTSPVSLAREMQAQGAGELLMHSIDREGTMSGYDTKLLRMVSDEVTVPVVALGGASSVDDFEAALDEGRATAVSAGSMFVFHGPHRAVLINLPERDRLDALRFGSTASEGVVVDE